MCCLAHGELAKLFLEPNIGLDHCQIRESYSRALEQGHLMYRELGWSADTIWYRGGRRLIGNWLWPKGGPLINPSRPSPDPEVATHVLAKGVAFVATL